MVQVGPDALAGEIVTPRAAADPRYRRHRPEPYRRRMPIFWWLGRLSYTKFITRELTSLGVAYAAVLLVVEAAAVRRGEAAYAAFLAWLHAPWTVALHAFVLLVLLFHTVTWLNLAPKALVLRIGGRRVPDLAVVGAHYLAWGAVSALIFWLLLGG